VAATSVIFRHIPFAGWGGFGVDIFFVVSGFVMCYVSFLDSRAFLIKRIIRIVPLYWFGTLGVFAVALLSPALLHNTSADWNHLLKSLLFIPYMREDHTIRPVLFLGWTLEYEAFFYVVFALGLACARGKLATGRHKYAYACTALFLALAAALGQTLRPASIALRFYTNPVILEFAFGAIAFLLWNRYRDRIAQTPIVWAIAVALLAYTAFLMFDLKIMDSHGAYLGKIPGFVWRGGLGFLLCISFLSLEGKIRFPKLWLLIGDASYSLYVFHPYVVELIDRKMISLRFLTPATVAAASIAIVACFVVAILSFQFFERPTNSFLRKKFVKSRPRLAVAGP